MRILLRARAFKLSEADFQALYACCQATPMQQDVHSDQAVAQGEIPQVDRRFDVEFFNQPRLVGAHGLVAQVQVFGDLLV